MEIDPLTYSPPRDMTKEARRKEKARIAAIYEKNVEKKMRQYIIERMGINTRYSDLDMGGLERPSFRQEKQFETEHEVEGMNLKEFMTSGNGKEAGSSGQPIKKKPKVSVPDFDKPKRKPKRKRSQERHDGREMELCEIAKKPYLPVRSFSSSRIKC